ncbi:thioesterase [Rhodopirellula sp. MGV]|nr:thioesterase [Rhodopirellula sp. MGV]PNY35775.1 acyl-CoA thioesterase [Rhodopirellula baltica]
MPTHPYFDLHHRVTADEIDSQQHVHNLRYLQWSLWAAGKHTAAIGWDAKQALSEGVGWVVREHSIQYRVAALLDDEIVIRTWVSDLQRFASRRKYVIFRPVDQAVIARIETRWVFVDLTRHKVLSIPDEAKQSLVVLDQAPTLPWEA